ncbi:hypothetical protein SAMD00019534_025000 [Acytostelium subglobosum LB1]|uniref:hypothetical protein n=1 Tax=Acytostelium subglobosum LB1 TaxID=1410327 RepID=UPI000644C97B|nr:hypothetical protein SAMD00019534_025000 [Acytostelium subglobosum LB1]GAM19325.1 hypothetical protein SAMD00019534_025000 [Acytostelium subglobosum LB1]|eukprot:XP_012757252.1 hypothetical protein SAMD00019534_025000 [Acytostelium subglobosum LB1]
MNSAKLLTILTSNDSAARFAATKLLVDLLNKDDGSAQLVAILKAQQQAGSMTSGWSIANSVATIAGTLVQFIPEIGPIAGRAMISMWNVLFSFKNGMDINKNSDKTSQVITAYKTLIKATVNRAIGVYDSEALHAAYEGASTYLKAYTTALSVYLRNPSVENNKETLRIAIFEAEKQYANIIAQCKKESHVIAELYMFAMCASIRLSLLRDAILRGQEWGITADYIATYYQAEFTKCIAEYTKHCTTTYKAAVDKLKSSTTSDVNLFNTITDLRNAMITYVFDLVAVWPLLNPAEFPEGVYMHQKTRLLMSDVVGLPVNPGAINTKDYYTATYDMIDQKMHEYQYYLYRGEHDKFCSQADETGNRLLWIQNSFKTGNSSPNLPSWASPGTMLGPPGGVSPISTTTSPFKTIGFSNSVQESIVIYADIIPRSFECSVGGDITGGPFDNNEAKRNGDFAVLLGTENSWHCAVDQYKFPNMPTKFSYEKDAVQDHYINLPYAIPFLNNIITTYQFAGHCIYHPFGLGINKDPMVRPAGTMDSACIAFAPIGLNNFNYVFNSKGATYLDPIKWSFHTGVTFVEDSFMPGVNECIVNAGCSITYKMDPTFAGSKVFYLRFIVRTKVASKITVSWSTSNYDIKVPVCTIYDVLDAGTLPAITLSKANLEQNKFTIKVPAGSAPLSLRSIILLPKGA